MPPLPPPQVFAQPLFVVLEQAILGCMPKLADGKEWPVRLVYRWVGREEGEEGEGVVYPSGVQVVGERRGVRGVRGGRSGLPVWCTGG